MNTKPVKIKRISKITKPATVCDIQVADNENLFISDEITKSPVLAHNCALVELVFDIKISGWILHYLARDSPMTIHRSEGKRISTEQKAAQLKLIEQYDRHWGIRSNMKKYKHLQILVDEKPCRNAEDYKKNFDSFTPCPLSQGGLCFQEKALNNHLRIVWSDYAQKL